MTRGDFMAKRSIFHAFWTALVNLKTEIDNDRVLAVSAGVTFYGILAVVPAITALISVFGLISSPQDVPGQLGQLAGFLPPEATTLLTEQAERIAAKANGTLSITAIVALLIALWSANGGTKALMEALGIAYGVRETRSFVRLNLVALKFTLGGLALTVVLAVLVAIVPLLLGWLSPGGVVETVFLWARWPFIFGIMMAVLAVMYRWAPDRPDARWAWISPGAVAASCGIILISAGLSWYVSGFGNYDETYGSLAAVVILMLWMWLSTVMVLIGAEINAELDRRSGTAVEQKATLAS
jgi:membrane protein